MNDVSLICLRRVGPIVLRLVALLISLGLSSYGLLFGYASAVGFIDQISGAEGARSPWLIVFGLTMAYAWIAWLVLGFAWAFQRRLHRWWPLSGTVVGILGIVFTAGFAIVFTFPSIIMATVLVNFHLRANRRPVADAPASSSVR